MVDTIKLSASYVGEKESKAVERVISKSYLGMGEETKLFEQELEQFFENESKVVCVSNGTAALQLSLQACGIGLGDEVIIPSITYVASFQAASATGAIPVACDIDLNTGCLDFKKIEQKITKKTKAIMYVHYAGGVGNRDVLFKIASKYNLRVIEDAAHSFGGTFNNKLIGTNGDITCFSFDGIKNITSAEGGAIVSSDEKIINKVLDLRLLGVIKDSHKRYSGRRSWDFEVKEQGWRYHLSNINAAIGREQLKCIGFFAKVRRDFAKTYMDGLKDLPIKFLELDLNNIVPHIFPILVAKEHRERLRDFLKLNNIETGVHYKPNHLLHKFLNNHCETAEEFGASVLSLPLHVGLSNTNISKVVHSIRDFFGDLK